METLQAPRFSKEKFDIYGVDGVMIGRGKHRKTLDIRRGKALFKYRQNTTEERIQMVLEYPQKANNAERRET